jgi:hypothetical protein
VNVYTITLERISTGERAPSMVTRQASEAEARAYVDDAIRGSPEPDDLRVVEVEAREAAASEPEEKQRSIRIPLRQDAWKQVKIAAVERGTTAHDLMIEALNDWFAKHGKPPIA